MEKYDYYEAVKEDIIDYLDEHFSGHHITEGMREKINDDLWVSDSVTGNASGSYTFNRWEAEENLCHNTELLGEALSEFCDGYNTLEKGAEACDVTIRLYLVGQLLDECIEAHNASVEAEEEDEAEDED